MPFYQLYEAVQTAPQSNGARISTNWVRARVIEMSNINRIVEKWSGIIDDTSIRGFYIEGPMGPPVPLADHEALITLSRKTCQDRAWRRLVLTKELMHTFDEDDEKTDSPEKLDQQANKLADPNAANSRQSRAENVALWRALAVLCSEANRLTFKAQIAEGEISLDVVSAKLTLPQAYIHNLFRDDFPEIIKRIL